MFWKVPSSLWLRCWLMLFGGRFIKYTNFAKCGENLNLFLETLAPFPSGTQWLSGRPRRAFIKWELFFFRLSCLFLYFQQIMISVKWHFFSLQLRQLQLKTFCRNYEEFAFYVFLSLLHHAHLYAYYAQSTSFFPIFF